MNDCNEIYSDSDVRLQHGQEILVMRHETNREGQDIPGEPEEANGIEGSLGEVEAW